MSATETVVKTAEDTAQEPLTGPQKMAVARAARAFGSYGEARKAMAKIAKAIVNLRLTFEKDGRPDFRGETPQYRGAIASLYEAAIADPDERESFKVAIRYWVGKEYAARVDSGSLKKKDLEGAGIVRAITPATAPTPAPEREPRRAATAAEMTATGIFSNDEELTPPEVLVKAEEIVAEHVADESLGVVVALQSIGRELGPVVAALRDEAARSKLPGRALKQAVQQVLSLAIDAAVLSDIDVEEHVVAWMSAHVDESVAA